jgi:hypothetical protein
LVTGTLDEADWAGAGRLAEPPPSVEARSAGFSAVGLAGSGRPAATGVGLAAAGFAKAAGGATGCRGVDGGVRGRLAAGCEGAWAGVAGFMEAAAGVTGCAGVDDVV